MGGNSSTSEKLCIFPEKTENEAVFFFPLKMYITNGDIRSKSMENLHQNQHVTHANFVAGLL